MRKISQTAYCRWAKTACAVWIVIHVSAAVNNLICSTRGPSYGPLGYPLSTCWLLALAVTVLLMARGRARGPARGLGWYWLLAAGLSAVFPAAARAWDIPPLLSLLAMVAAPWMPLAPLLEFVPFSVMVSCAVFSLCCAGLCLWIGRGRG